MQERFFSFVKVKTFTIICKWLFFTENLSWKASFWFGSCASYGSRSFPSWVVCMCCSQWWDWSSRACSPPSMRTRSDRCSSPCGCPTMTPTGHQTMNCFYWCRWLCVLCLSRLFVVSISKHPISELGIGSWVWVKHLYFKGSQTNLDFDKYLTSNSSSWNRVSCLRDLGWHGLMVWRF